jgi:hypothetical protein
MRSFLGRVPAGMTSMLTEPRGTRAGGVAPSLWLASLARPCGPAGLRRSNLPLGQPPVTLAGERERAMQEGGVATGSDYDACAGSNV